MTDDARKRMSKALRRELVEKELVRRQALRTPDSETSGGPDDAWPPPVQQQAQQHQQQQQQQQDQINEWEAQKAHPKQDQERPR
jgi:hypothetical protein